MFTKMQKDLIYKYRNLSHDFRDGFLSAFDFIYYDEDIAVKSESVGKVISKFMEEKNTETAKTPSEKFHDILSAPAIRNPVPNKAADGKRVNTLMREAGLK